MTDEQKQAAEILKNVGDNGLDPEEAVEQLIALGGSRDDARELVFIAQGGDDVIVVENNVSQ